MAAIGHQHGVNKARGCAAAVYLGAVASLWPVSTVHAQPMYFPTMGQDWGWTHIGQPGNAAYDGRFGAQQSVVNTTGRGRVNHEYAIQTGQLTIGQWLEFSNTISSNPANFALSRQLALSIPGMSGAPPVGIVEDVNYSGPGTRGYATSAARLNDPMILTWRRAALIANWLHHDRTNDLSLCLSGAYDVSSWSGPGDGFTITDDAHLPGARYWIPSLDEWLKAAFWDNNRHGPEQGDWRQFSYGDGGPGSPHWRGLQRVGGSGTEFTETPVLTASSGQTYAWTVMDTGPYVNFAVPVGPISSAGIRFATSVPAPSSLLYLTCFATICVRRRCRSAH